MKASQQIRVLFALGYVAILALVSQFLFGTLFPRPDSPQSIWFYSSFLSILLGDLLFQPFFTKPTDALANGLSAALLVFGTIYYVPQSQFVLPQTLILWQVLAGVSVGVIFLAVVAMLFGMSDNFIMRKFAETATRITRWLGSPKTLFGAILFLALLSFHSRPVAIVVILATWFLITVGQPVEHVYDLAEATYQTLREQPPNRLGALLFRREPGILMIRLDGPRAPKFGTLLAVLLDDGKCELGLVIDTHRLAGDQWTRALSFGRILSRSQIPGAKGQTGTALEIAPDTLSAPLLSDEIYQRREEFAGVVVEHTELDLVKVEVTNEAIDLESGSLLETRIDKQLTIYQVIQASTDSENLEKQNRHGFTEVTARKVGTWDEELQCFSAVPWLPVIYSPVFIHQKVEGVQFDIDSIGCLPNTNYHAKIDTSELVTHNTAVLGILGSGKTFLSLELIQRMVTDKIHCLVLDITGEYSTRLERYINSDEQTRLNDELMAVTQRQQPANNGAFRNALKTGLEEFVQDDNWLVWVIDPSEYRVTWPHIFQNKPAIDATPAMVTADVSVASLEVSRDLDNGGEPRLCLVLEEAHTLAPEWNSVVTDDEKYAPVVTAKAILQGRKYGYGCLIVTQRTANVTKSLLNQCNTVFALRAFDATGMEFLKNYIGADYSDTLSTLAPRHCVVFGRAISNSNTPLLVKLNDRDDFLAAIEGSGDEVDEDIPF